MKSVTWCSGGGGEGGGAVGESGRRVALRGSSLSVNATPPSPESRSHHDSVRSLLNPLMPFPVAMLQRPPK